MMQLDDVVDATNQDPERFEEARHRTVRWLDRCLEVHTRHEQNRYFFLIFFGSDRSLRSANLRMSVRFKIV